MFRQIQGNARYCLLFEPMFLIPYNMVITYASVYMLQLGLDKAQVGLIATICSALQVFSSLASGYLTDRLGRRKALLWFDLVSWSVPAAIWIVSSNVWFFVAAAVVNSLVKIPSTAFYCLLIEDTPVEARSKVFSIIQFTGAAGGVFAPLAALLIARYDLVTSVRLMYAFFFVSTAVMFFARHYFLYDTETSTTKMREARSGTWRTIAKQYISTGGAFLRNKTVLPILLVYVLFNFQVVLKNTFLSVYMIDSLGFDAAAIAWFPAVSSVAMLAALYFIVPRLKHGRMMHYIAAGLAVTALSYALLLASPPGSFAVVIVTTVLHALGTLLIMPFMESFLSTVVSDNDRAPFYALFTVCTMLFTSPAGVVGGWLYGIRPEAPFLFITVGLIACFAVMIGVARGVARKAGAHSA